ncbi:serine hydrolase [Sediminibacterium sp.]|uniref:serine hydrolase domain-containing protein n=1 Tax=Sediminibacterium sp. TaxID=1917865 RepID=UPI00273627D9|nr:serine hydrolase domain-containing protein [Sediminibacterium sp.]MDP3394706.1 serine hydrolase domain-containing protein [Sediminibacterium sp.]MDP3568541.1 serine hydrolase domain-containing protein [Sediminibacterium sp.]
MPKTYYFLLVVLLLISDKAELIAQNKEAESAIQVIMNSHKVMGMSVAVVKKNEIVYAQSFGLKNQEMQTPLTNSAIFRIASISKSFSATAIMQLVEKRLISLDDDMSKLVGFIIRNPKFPETPITLRMVLSHRSSINDSQGYFSLDAINPAKNANWAKCYNNYAPDSGYMYCNLNYNMVGTIIEKISGERFDTYIQQHILQPLQLYGGYCVDSLDKQKFAAIYEYNSDSVKFILSPNAYAPRSEEIANYTMGYSTPIFSPTGGMKISATDLAKYMIMHSRMGKANGKRIISRRSAKQMQTMLSEKEQYGLALSKSNKLINGITLTGHTGSAYGLNSAMFFEPNKKYGFVIIINGSEQKYIDGFNAIIKKTVNSLYENIILK